MKQQLKYSEQIVWKIRLEVFELEEQNKTKKYFDKGIDLKNVKHEAYNRKIKLQYLQGYKSIC